MSILPQQCCNRLGRFLHWDYNTPQFLAFVLSFPALLYLTAYLATLIPLISFAFFILYVFILLTVFPIPLPLPASWKVPRSLLHAFFLAWAVAGLVPLESYLPFFNIAK